MATKWQNKKQILFGLRYPLYETIEMWIAPLNVVLFVQSTFVEYMNMYVIMGPVVLIGIFGCLKHDMQVLKTMQEQ